MTSIQQKGISSERLRESSSVNADHFECSICRDVLWKPIACQSCETPFCSPCMDKWLAENPSKCPYQCEKYTERKCPPFIAKLLSQLQISCFYQSNGCDQVLSYEALDKHEIECDYQPKQCPGCEIDMLKKDFAIHETTCDLIKLTCEDCKFMYRKSEGDKEHTEVICLKKQIKQLENICEESKEEVKKLNSQLVELNEIRLWSKQRIINFTDLPSANTEPRLVPETYQGLRWNGFHYIHELYVRKHRLNSGYTTSFLPTGSLHIGFCPQEASIGVEASNETFTLVSLLVSAAWCDDMVLIIKGFQNSLTIHHTEIILLFGRPQRMSLNWTDIDKLVFNTRGGRAHETNCSHAGSHVILSELVINNATTKNSNQ